MSARTSEEKKNVIGSLDILHPATFIAGSFYARNWKRRSGDYDGFLCIQQAHFLPIDREFGRGSRERRYLRNVQSVNLSGVMEKLHTSSLTSPRPGRITVRKLKDRGATGVRRKASVSG